MKALLKARPGPGLELAEVSEPRPGRHDVLIRVLRTGICGTDIHLQQWTPWASSTLTLPRVLGHEFVGEIVEVGAGVGALRCGQLVSGEGHVTCDRCVHCRAERRHLCLHAQGVGVERDGAFAEYLKLPAQNVWVHPDDVSLDVAVLSDAFGNAVHVADTFPLVGHSVLITGAGPIGLMAAAVAVHRGASPVVVTDTSLYRLELARAVGAHRTVKAGPGALNRVRCELRLPDGFDICFEMSGSKDALDDVQTAVTRGGKIAVLGLPDEHIPTDWADIALRILTIQGVSGRRVFDTWHSMAALLAEGVDPSIVVTHHFPAEQHAEAFAIAAEANAGKVVLDWAEPKGTGR